MDIYKEQDMLHHMATILVYYESKMVAKIQKSSDLGEICLPSRFSSCELISFIVFGIGSHVMILQITSYLVIIIIILSLFRQKFVRHISRRCLDQSLWNLVGISYAIRSCVFKGWFFQNGYRCHENGQNAKKKWKTQKRS